MRWKRSSGVLAHPTSLPGRFGIGELGTPAFAFADFLEAGGQRLWQVLPLGPTGYGDSPYQSFSAFAGNTLLISPDELHRAGLLSAEDLDQTAEFPTDFVDFGRVISFKRSLLNKAYGSFKQTDDPELKADFLAFCQKATSWLEDYALFRALKDAHDGAAWNTWERELVKREGDALAEAREKLREPIEAERFVQYLFFKQWERLKSYCNQREIKIVGDIPIFVAYDSADVWARPDQFKLDDDANPTVVAGVPPDYFSATGQLWGNPIYRWDRMREDGFAWWIERVRAAFELVDILRIDHFRGFAASWEVPGGEATAERGSWVEVPGRQLFTALKGALGNLPIIAEDLGVITPDVEALREEFGFPGMRVLQFAFSSNSSNKDLPHNHVQDCVVYTGTHDNDTCVGWFNSTAGPGSTRDADQITREREYCLKYLRSDGHAIHWDFIAAAFASVADTAIVPLQDVLGLDSRARMNLPASDQGNWTWRVRPEALASEVGGRLRELSVVYGRAAD